MNIIISALRACAIAPLTSCDNKGYDFISPTTVFTFFYKYIWVDTATGKLRFDILAIYKNSNSSNCFFFFLYTVRRKYKLASKRYFMWQPLLETCQWISVQTRDTWLSGSWKAGSTWHISMVATLEVTTDIQWGLTLTCDTYSRDLFRW